MDPVGEAGAFLQSYGWYCVGAALVVVFVVRPKLEELSHARSLAAAQNPARREALDRKRREVVDRQQHTLAEDVKNNPKVGDSNVKIREQSRFFAVSQPYAGAWHAVPPDHTKATQLATPLVVPCSATWGCTSRR